MLKLCISYVSLIIGIYLGFKLPYFLKLIKIFRLKKEYKSRNNFICYTCLGEIRSEYIKVNDYDIFKDDDGIIKGISKCPICYTDIPVKINDGKWVLSY